MKTLLVASVMTLALMKPPGVMIDSDLVAQEEEICDVMCFSVTDQETGEVGTSQRASHSAPRRLAPTHPDPYST